MKPNSADIVLVRPLYAGNVGSVARAMLNCGLERLVVVEPPWDTWPDDARRMASGADAVLDSARRASSVAEALAPYVLAAATTARARSEGPAPLTHREALPQLVAAATSGPVAVVFGPEDRGLSAEEMDACALRIRIPTSPLHSSLNLSQAVLLIAHELYMLAQDPKAADPRERATLDDVEGFLGELTAILGDVGFLNPQNPHHILEVLRPIFLRNDLDPREVRTLRGMCRQIKWALDARKPTA